MATAIRLRALLEKLEVKKYFFEMNYWHRLHKSSRLRVYLFRLDLQVNKSAHLKLN